MKRALALLLLTTPLAAQVPSPGGFGTTVRAGTIFESYSFGSGLAFDSISRISEITTPIIVSHRFGPRLNVDLATAFARATMHTTDGRDVSASGLTDTDVRATFAVVPGRLLLTVVGTLPTGRQTVPDSTLALFGALATDLLDFTTPNFGSGGAVTAGFATAAKWGGSWAVGGGASYRYNAGFTPFSGSGELKPGSEGRARLGVEGPLPGGKYLRAALMYTLNQHDELSGSDASITGDRVLLYSSVSMPLGRSSFSLYGFDMLRLSPRSVSTTYAVPRGNVLALGARLERPLSPRATLVPALEFRHELNDQGAGMALLGFLVRPGLDLRYRLSGPMSFVLQGQCAVGQLENDGTKVSLLSPRLSAVLEWTR